LPNCFPGIQLQSWFIPTGLKFKLRLALPATLVICILQFPSRLYYTLYGRNVPYTEFFTLRNAVQIRRICSHLTIPQDIIQSLLGCCRKCFICLRQVSDLLSHSFVSGVLIIP